MELMNEYQNIDQTGGAYSSMPVFGCATKGPVLENLPGYTPGTAGTMINGLDPLTTTVTTGLANMVAGAAGAVSAVNGTAGTVNSIVNQTGSTPGGWFVISQGVAPAYSLSAFAWNQQICVDRRSAPNNDAFCQTGYKTDATWSGWPNGVCDGWNIGTGDKVVSLRKVKDITDGLSSSLLLGEINSDIRQAGTGNMVYRDHAFSGGGELTRALGGNGNVNGNPNFLYNQLVFPDQNFDIMGWSTVRGYWGGPHPGGCTVVTADGAVTSVAFGSDITRFVGIQDGLVTDASVLGR